MELPTNSTHTAGFSLLELITVLVILSTLFIIFFIFYTPNDTDLISQTNVLKTNIRYAQARAMNTDSSWGIRYQTEGDRREYWLFQYPDTQEKIVLPGQTADSVRLDEFGLAIAGVDFNIRFDAWGIPLVSGRSFNGGQLVLSIFRDASQSELIAITENTGFIP